MSSQTEFTTFGAGCFWSIEARFRAQEGVLEAISGYMGGQPEPDYKTVCSGTSGHAEVVQLEFYPQRVSFETLLGLFFDMHNPTTLNRQGPDIGSQYRSAIFFHSSDQEKVALAVIKTLDQSGRWPQPVITRVEAAMPFWRAEEYHQRYLEKHGLGFCSI